MLSHFHQLDPFSARLPSGEPQCWLSHDLEWDAQVRQSKRITSRDKYWLLAHDFDVLEKSRTPQCV